MPYLSTSEQRVRAMVVASALLVFLLYLRNYSDLILIDDAFMAFRYVQNVVAGRGLVFNPGERIWGFTSPLHTLLLILPAALGLPIPTTAAVLGLSLNSATALVWWQLGRAWLPLWLRAGIAMVVLATPSQSFFLGLEINLLIFLQSLFLLCLLRQRANGAAFVASLCCLTRPDALLLVVPLLLFTRSTRNPKCVAIFAASGVAWIAFTALYYGALLPNSFYSKRGMSTFFEFVQNTRRTFRWWIANPLGVSPGAWRVLQYPATLLAVVPLFLRRLPWPIRYALGAYPCLLVASYGVIGSVPNHSWEVFAAFEFGMVSAALAFCLLLSYRKSPILLGGLLGVFVFQNLAFGFRDERNSLQQYWKGTRQISYRHIAAYLKERVEPTEWVAYAEPGTLAFFSDVKILDLNGIVSPRLAANSTLPKYFINSGGEQQLLNATKYRRVHQFPYLGFRHLNFYERDSKTRYN